MITPTRRSGRVWAVLLAALTVVLPVACGQHPTGTAKRLALSACTVAGQPARCGTLSVPENPGDPAGRHIKLKIVVLPASGTPAADDAVFYLAGGPGGAAIDEVANVAATLVGVRDHRDIVFVDQRGTGGSNPVAYPSKPPPRPRGLTDSEYAALAVRDCLDRLHADPRFYTTPYAVDDFDAVRAALGYRAVDLYGGSYGATAAQVYLARHGSRVRVAVLSGATLLDVPMFETWPRHAQEALDKVIARCAADRACDTAYPHLAADLATLQHLLAGHPERVRTGDGNRVVVTADSLAGTVQLMTKSSEAARLLPLALHTAAVHHDFTTLGSQQVALGQPSSPTTQVMPIVVTCLEPWARVDPAAVAAESRGSYLGRVYREGLRDRLVCRYLPRADVGPRTVTSNVPVLFVEGGSDPQDPPENVADARRHFPRSRTVVVPWAGHSWVWDGCVSRLVADTLSRGSVPPGETGCVAAAPPPVFDLSG